MQTEYDFFVIGAGSAGVRAARIAAGLGASVGIAEDLYFGGTCVNVGCVPKKLYVYAAEFAEEFAAARGFGWMGEQAQHSWAELLTNKNREIARLNAIYHKLLQDAGVHIVQGHARLLGEGRVAVGAAVYRAKHTLLATGGWPRKPEFPGAEHVLTSNEFFKLDSTPQKVLLQGGGYVAIELAGIFNGLGSETELVYRGNMLLRGFDRDIRNFVFDEVRKKGVQITLSADIKRIKKVAEEKFVVHLNNGEQREVSAVVSAIGRAPKIEGLGLENTAIRLSESGHICVDENFATKEKGVYAVGDVVGRKELTPVALAEGMALAKYLFADEPINIDYEKIPTAVFCQPNIATVGLTEDEARKRKLKISTYVSSFKPLKHTLSGSEEKTFIKVIVNKEDDKVLGCHMVGAHAGEIIQGLAVALTAGASKRDFDLTLGIHPTAAEEFVTLRSPRS